MSSNECVCGGVLWLKQRPGVKEAGHANTVAADASADGSQAE